MRRIKTFIKNIHILYSYSKKIKHTKYLLKKELGEVQFKFASFGGADINYYLLRNNKKFAVLRLAIADYKDTNQAIARFVKKKRLDREYEAYMKGFKKGLTPSVIYKSDDTLVCEYIKGDRAYDILKKDTTKVWSILSDAIITYRKLHDLGITHLDATLKNFIVENGNMKVIDFEYYPSSDLSIEMQKAYDYVRIIEHTLRNVPKNHQENYHEFINFLKDIVPYEVKNADFSLVEQWIGNIETFQLYTSLNNEVFTKLTFKR